MPEVSGSTGAEASPIVSRSGRGGRVVVFEGKLAALGDRYARLSFLVGDMVVTYQVDVKG